MGFLRPDFDLDLVFELPPELPLGFVADWAPALGLDFDSGLEFVLDLIVFFVEMGDIARILS